MKGGLALTASTLVALSSVAASAQCRTACVAGEARDPYGCCLEAPHTTRRIVREASDAHPESIVGDASSTLAPDATTESYAWARAWLARARAFEPTSRVRATVEYRRAAGAALVFLAAAPNDPRAGRMRAVLIAALDGLGMIDAAELEAAALGGPRPSPEPEALRTLRADTLSNLAWAHHTLARRLDTTTNASRRARAIARYRRAVDYYRLYLASSPDLAAAPSARSELANALVAAGDYLDAAAELEELARTVPSRRAEGLRRALDACERALAAEVRASRIALRTDPPPPSQRPPFAEPLPFPAPLRRLFDARENYLIATRDAPEPQFFREQALENALWLYRYGSFDDARSRLTALLTERCDDRAARNAFTVLALIDPPAPDARLATDVCALHRAACAERPGAPACLASSR